MPENRLRRLWGADQTAVNGWLTIPSAWTAEVLARVGFDALTIDLQHGLSDYSTAVAILQAISATEAVPLVRVPWNEPAGIMRMLDAGAQGIICPLVNTRGQAQAFVGACRYPPQGYRSYGPIRARQTAGPTYFAQANRTILTLAMVETVEALENLEEILSVEGLDGIYVGLVDLGISMGLPGLANPEHPKLQKAIEHLVSATQKRSRIAGIHASSPLMAGTWSQRGFRLVTPINDSETLRSRALQILRKTQKSLASGLR